MRPSGHPTPTCVGPRRRCWTLVLPLLLAIAGVSCGRDDRPAHRTQRPSSTTTARATTTTEHAVTTTSSSAPLRTPTTDPPPDTSIASPAPTGTTPAEQEVIDQYVGYWQARYEANHGTPDPASPALRRYATGPQLQMVIVETKKNLEAGLSFENPKHPRSFRRIVVESIDGDHAVVQECVVDDGVVVRRNTGAVVNDDVGTHSVRAKLTRIDGSWRVAKARLIQHWEGVAGCALAS